PSGVQVVSIGFKVDARFGKAELEFNPISEVQNFTVLVPRGSQMSVSGEGLAASPEAGTPDPQYEALFVEQGLQGGKPLTVQVAGLPEGRRRIWIVGATVGAMLGLLTAGLALRTRPKITGRAGEALLVG